MLFSEIDHRLSVVKRWGILHTIQTQSVAEHVHNVVRIAARIAVDWFAIEDSDELLDVVLYAHHHDDLEAFSGDLPSMVKPYLDEDAIARDHRHLVSPYNPIHFDQTKEVVKLADKLEGYHFLCIEVALGNKYVEEHWVKEAAIISDYVYATWPDNHELREKVNREMERMRNERSSRFSMRGR